MTDGPQADLEGAPDAGPPAGSGYAIAPAGVVALGAVVFALSLAFGTVTIAPSKQAAPVVRSPATLAAGALVGAPVLDAAVALPRLAPADPPDVRRRARWKRAAEDAERARRSAIERAARAVALAAPAPVAVAAPPPVAPGPVFTAPPAEPSPNVPAAPPPAPAESESPAPTFDDGGVPDSGEFDYGDSP